MKYSSQIIASLLVLCLIFPQVTRAESIDDKYTHISPNQSLGGSEYMHGQGYQKLLMRVLMFGATPSQGIHYFPEGTDLLFAVLYAGGYGDSTKLSSIEIRRKGVKNLIEVDLEDLIEEGGDVPKLREGDVVYIPFNYRKYMQEFYMWTGFISAVTAFTLAVLAYTK